MKGRKREGRSQESEAEWPNSGFWLRFLFQSQFRGPCHFDEGAYTSFIRERLRLLSFNAFEFHAAFCGALSNAVDQISQKHKGGSAVLAGIVAGRE